MGYKAAGVRSAAAVDAEPISAGTRVTVKNVTSRPNLNGKAGHVLFYDVGRQRYAVSINGMTISLHGLLLSPTAIDLSILWRRAAQP